MTHDPTIDFGELGARVRAHVCAAFGVLVADLEDALMLGDRPVYGPVERPRMALAEPYRPRLVGRRWHHGTPMGIRKDEGVQVVADPREVDLARQKDERRWAAR